ncbi:MAG TPA: hypothetical protein VK164_08735 [Flavobacterium sp.]|uniref:hypothetical protein n=1 Tax=Flavobacterium sp. TaxID=239 RepID=UPI002B4AB93E|nr:hypothetical protein [Flavobacterium sp.]HLO74005.1 hypothetical protein [Flavobacterium sp.]
MKKYLLFFTFFIILSNCEKVDCDKLEKYYKEDNCNIIVSKMPIPDSRHNFYILGKSSMTNLDTIYDEENRWFCQFYKYLEKGDTIIKNKGELLFSIHKKDTVLSFNFECDGKIYTPASASILLVPTTKSNTER